MRFEIAFNFEHLGTYEELKELGAELVTKNANGENTYAHYEIELENFKDLEGLLKRVSFMKGWTCYALVSFDPPIIYLDDE
jgi:hypothetical protein